MLADKDHSQCSFIVLEPNLIELMYYLTRS